jgi:hypothetical protein
MTDRILALKDGVSLVGLQPEALYGIDVCLFVFHDAGLRMTLTSCRDGAHGKYSHHFKGLAWDIRVWDLTGRIDWMCRKLREKLGPDYQVINEDDHIHVEYDPLDLDG